ASCTCGMGGSRVAACSRADPLQRPARPCRDDGLVRSESGVKGAMCPSKVVEGFERGWIVPIGGAEEKEHDPRILRRFVELCGGSDADIVVIPTASQLSTTGPKYEHVFAELGAGRVTALDFDTRRDASEDN